MSKKWMCSSVFKKPHKLVEPITLCSLVRSKHLISNNRRSRPNSKSMEIVLLGHRLPHFCVNFVLYKKAHYEGKRNMSFANSSPPVECMTHYINCSQQLLTRIRLFSAIETLISIDISTSALFVHLAPIKHEVSFFYPSMALLPNGIAFYLSLLISTFPRRKGRTKWRRT